MRPRRRHRDVCRIAPRGWSPCRASAVGRLPAHLHGPGRSEVRRGKLARPAGGLGAAGDRDGDRRAVGHDGDRRRQFRRDDDDPVRAADPSGGGDLLGRRRADLDPGLFRLHLCRLGRGGPAAVFDRLRQLDRLCGDLPDRHAGHALWRAAGAPAEQAAAGDGFAVFLLC